VNTDPVSVRLVPAAAWSAVDPAPWGSAAQPGRLNQPRRNGLEVLNELKTDPDLQTIAVVILTTSRAQQDILGSAAVLLAW